MQNLRRPPLPTLWTKVVDWIWCPWNFQTVVALDCLMHVYGTTIVAFVVWLELTFCPMYLRINIPIAPNPSKLQLVAGCWLQYFWCSCAFLRYNVWHTASSWNLRKTLNLFCLSCTFWCTWKRYMSAAIWDLRKLSDWNLWKELHLNLWKKVCLVHEARSYILVLFTDEFTTVKAEHHQYLKNVVPWELRKQHQAASWDVSAH